MTRYSIEPKTRIYVKGYGFLSVTRKYKKQILDKGVDVSTKAVPKADEFIGNKISDAVTKSKDNYSTRKKRGNNKKIEKSIIKMEPYKISSLLNDSTVSNFLTKKWVKVNDLSSGQYSDNKNIRFKTSMLRPDLCDYNHACIVVKG